jgi:poly(hydroxyalkanoate) granule-associated protein
MTEKKLKRTTSKPSMVDGVRDSANQIWLAGLGAFAKAQEEGSKVFDSLVKEGQEVDSKTRDAAEDAAKSVKSNVEGRVSGARKQASDTWDKLEGVFEERVARVLNRLGVPSKQDIDALNKQIDSLSKELKALKGDSKPAAAKKTTTTRRRTSTASKTTAKS